MNGPLPGLLGEIEDIVGREIALQVAESHGGTRIDLPPRARPGHWLTELIGFDAADAICRGLAIHDASGRERAICHEVLPMGPTGKQALARQGVVEALNSGLGPREAARKAGVHERTAYRVWAQMKRARGQNPNAH